MNQQQIEKHAEDVKGFLFPFGTFLGKCIIPYWLDCPSAIGPGYVSVEFGEIPHSNGSYSLEIIELATTHDRTRSGIHEISVVFNRNPYCQLRLKKNKPEKREGEFVLRTCSASGIGTTSWFPGLDIMGWGGILPIFYRAVENELLSLYSEVTPTRIYVVGSKIEVEKIVVSLRKLAASVQQDEEKIPWLLKAW